MSYKVVTTDGAYCGPHPVLSGRRWTESQAKAVAERMNERAAALNIQTRYEVKPA